MGVLTKTSDVLNQFRAYEAAQKAALKVTGAFESACNEGRPAKECRELWAAVGVAETDLEREWQAYKRIAPAKIGTKR